MLAFGGLVVGLWVERRRRRHDERLWEEGRRQAEEERRDREAMQARLVSVDIAWQFHHSGGYTAAVNILNESDASIRDIETRLVPVGPPSEG